MYGVAISIAAYFIAWLRAGRRGRTIHPGKSSPLSRNPVWNVRETTVVSPHDSPRIMCRSGVFNQAPAPPANLPPFPRYFL